MPTEMVKPKADRLALVARAAASRSAPGGAATDAKHEAKRRAGTSFALGLELAGVLSRAGELGAATRGQRAAAGRELKTPVVAWRIEPSGESCGYRRDERTRKRAPRRSSSPPRWPRWSSGDRSRSCVRCCRLGRGGVRRPTPRSWTAGRSCWPPAGGNAGVGSCVDASSRRSWSGCRSRPCSSDRGRRDDGPRRHRASALDCKT